MRKIALLGCLGAVSACQPTSGGAAAPPASDEHALLGTLAPDFDLPRVGQGAEASRFRLSEQRGKLVVIDFWATWCAPCRESFPVYESLSRARSEDTVLVAVSVDEDPAGIPTFVEQTGVTFPVVWDEGQAVSSAFEPPTMPTSYVVDQHGIVRFVHAGFRTGDGEKLEAVLDSMR